MKKITYKIKKKLDGNIVQENRSGYQASKHFAIYKKFQPDQWGVDHIPTGQSMGFFFVREKRKECQEICLKIEKICGDSLQFTETPLPDILLRAVRAIKEQAIKR